jgi:cell division protein FtsN
VATPAPAPAPVVAAAPAPAAPAVANTPSSGGFYMQIASLPSEAEAQKTYNSMSAKFGSVIGGRGVDIKRAEVAGKGTYYRVRIPAGDRSEAAALCERFRAAGGSCLVAR